MRLTDRRKKAISQGSQYGHQHQQGQSSTAPPQKQTHCCRYLNQWQCHRISPGHPDQISTHPTGHDRNPLRQSIYIPVVIIKNSIQLEYSKCIESRIKMKHSLTVPGMCPKQVQSKYSENQCASQNIGFSCRIHIFNKPSFRHFICSYFHKKCKDRNTVLCQHVKVQFYIP